MIAVSTYALVLVPVFWLLNDVRLFAITWVGVGVSLSARELHRRGHMNGGAFLLAAMMSWHMLEAVRVFGLGVGFELYFPLVLLVIYISGMPAGVKALLSLAVLGLTVWQLLMLRGHAGSGPHSPLAQEALLVANLVIVSMLFAVILKELEEVTERIERNYRREASCDALTGVSNRRALLRVVARALHERRPFALLLLDVDHFKRINDDHGHDLGDRALCHLVQCLCQGLRDQDVLGRYGGEEFVVVMHDMALDDAVEVAERLAARVRERPYAQTSHALHMTVSMGVVVSSQATSLDALMRLADRRLYRAKQTGRDRVVAVDATEDPAVTDAPILRVG